MPRGFVGRPAAKYLGQTTDAHRTAVTAGNQTTQQTQARMAATATDSQAPPLLANSANPRERQLPFGPEDATTGSFTTGRRNSSNIVVNEQEYESITRRVSQTDEQLGECMYKIAQEIEALCQASFILPSAAPRCMSVSDDVKRSLGQFRSVTEDMVIQARRFAREITSIGG